MPYVHGTLERLRKSSPAQFEFYQAAEEVLECLRPLLDRNPRYHQHSIIERIVEPERQIMFRVCWTDDAGKIRSTRGIGSSSTLRWAPARGACAFTPA